MRGLSSSLMEKVRRDIINFTIMQIYVSNIQKGLFDYAIFLLEMRVQYIPVSAMHMTLGESYIDT